MAKGEKNEGDLNWDEVFSKGAYCVGGGFMVGCGLSVLMSSSRFLAWPVLFSTGVGLGLAVVNLEGQMWNKGQKDSVTFENPWTKARDKSEDSQAPTLGRDETTRRIRAGSRRAPEPHWRPDKEPVPAVPLEKDRREEEAHLGKDREYPRKDREYPVKESGGMEYPDAQEGQEREYRDKDKDIRELKPCPRPPKNKKANSHKKENEPKEKKVIEVEADPSLLVD